MPFAPGHRSWLKGVCAGRVLGRCLSFFARRPFPAWGPTHRSPGLFPPMASFDGFRRSSLSRTQFSACRHP